MKEKFNFVLIKLQINRRIPGKLLKVSLSAICELYTKTTKQLAESPISVISAKAFAQK